MSITHLVELQEIDFQLDDLNSLLGDLPKMVEELNKTVPIGRIAEPKDIVDVILFLLSDESRYMCGSVVEVNGAKPVS